MDQPLISVYITNYNYGSFIRKAIQSVLDQTIDNYELIIIDDGSSDNSKDIIQEYTDLPFIQVIYQQNKGLNVSNNIALRASKGKYIMRLDADDYLAPNALEVLSHRLEADDELGLVFPDYYTVDEEGNLLELHQRHDFKKEVKLFDQAAHGACTMIRCNFLRKLGGYNESFSCQDGYELWVKFTRHYKVQNVNEALFFYRQHGKNLTSNETRILTTRARINQTYIDAESIKVAALAVIPIRNGLNSIAFEELGGKKLIDIKIEQALKSSSLQDIVVTSPSDDVAQYIGENYKDDRLQFIKRPKEYTRHNIPLGQTVKYILEQKKIQQNNYNSIILLSSEFPFVEKSHIEDALNTMFLFDSDSLMSVRLESSMMFQHHGSGMVPILNQDKFNRVEREALFRNTGGITCVRMDVFMETHKMLYGKIGHIVLDQKTAQGISSNYDLQLVRLIQEQL
ncbi:MAG: glycosyltransferase [Marinoscillum sp.]